ASFPRRSRIDQRGPVFRQTFLLPIIAPQTSSRRLTAIPRPAQCGAMIVARARAGSAGEGNPAFDRLAGLLALGRPLIMGILNVTPDSFSDGGRFLDPSQAM